MKALSLDQPWASLVAWGLKKNETRGWDTSYRGPLLIHSTVRWGLKQRSAEHLLRTYREVKEALDDHGQPFGCALAIVTLHSTISTESWLKQASPEERRYSQHEPNRLSVEVAAGDYGPGRFVWILRDLKPLPKPIPMRGRQRIWNAPDVELGL